MKIPTLNAYDENTTEAKSDSYPYGRLKCQAKWWIESSGSKGQRVCFQNINPKTGRVNAAKKSVYGIIKVLIKNEENGHIQTAGVSHYDTAQETQAFLDRYEFIREKDVKFLENLIAMKARAEKHFAEHPIKFTITTLAPVQIVG